jgi:hypothetical protein
LRAPSALTCAKWLGNRFLIATLLLGVGFAVFDVMLERQMSDMLEKIPLDSATKSGSSRRARFVAPGLPVDAGAGKRRMGDCAQHLR